MPKKLITVWLALTMFLFSSVSIFAYADSKTVQGEYLLKDVVIDGQNILNYKLSDPIVAYNGFIYVAMDETMGNLLGITAVMDTVSRTVYITPKDKQWVDFCQGDVVNNLDDISLAPMANVGVCVATEAYPNGVQLDLSNRPVMSYGSVVYVPLNAIVDSGVLGWTLHWDTYSGAILSTDPNVSASTFFSADQSAYKAGLIAYIMGKNRKVSFQQAQNLIQYFEIYGGIYGGIDEELLIAMAETESSFYETVRNASSATGLLQIKPFVAAPYGFTLAQLLQYKYNVQMGCILLNHAITEFNGDLSLALSGYACGEYAVKRGNYSLKYYNQWIQKYFNIIMYASTYQI